jgi:hypothetical protein
MSFVNPPSHWNLVRIIDCDDTWESLRKCEGMVVVTLHTKQTRLYRVTGITDRPVYRLKIYRERMKDYYEDKHGVELKRLDLPAFECENTNVIPVELCYVDLIPGIPLFYRPMRNPSSPQTLSTLNHFGRLSVSNDWEESQPSSSSQDQHRSAHLNSAQ